MQKNSDDFNFGQNKCPKIKPSKIFTVWYKTLKVVSGRRHVIFQKRMRVFHQGFKHEKTDESTRPQAKCFYCFRVFETPMKHEACVFEITSPAKEN